MRHRVICLCGMLMGVLGAAPFAWAASQAEESLSTEQRDMSWIGFQAAQDGARLQLRTTDRVAYAIKKVDAQVIEIWLNNTGIGRPNNQRALPTSYFDSPIASITPRVIDDATPSVVITVELRETGIVIHDQQRDNTLVVDFIRPNKP